MSSAGGFRSIGRCGDSRPLRRGASPSSLIPDGPDFLANEFVAVDFETANRKGGVSACQIALVKVEEGRIVDRAATLIKPPPGWDRFEFTYLHGIGPTHVREAPMWSQIAPRIAEFVGDAPVWAHNSSFDSVVLDRFGYWDFSYNLSCLDSRRKRRSSYGHQG